MIDAIGLFGYYVGMSVGSLYALWLFYLAVMNLVRARNAGTLTKVALVLGYPIFIVGLALDIFLNWTVLTVLFIEWPRETTITARLRRHYKSRATWRSWVAAWFGKHLLDPFDPKGAHIS